MSHTKIAKNEAFASGAHNLLAGCAALRAGDVLLILHEPKGAGYFSDGLPDAISRQAGEMGIKVKTAEVPFTPAPGDFDPAVRDAMRTADCSLFLARAGDQVRFRAADKSANIVVCYALDEAALASEFGRASYAGFVALKQAMDRAVGAARHIRVTCSLGTSFSGALNRAGDAKDVTVRRFPMSVFAPNDAAGFSGQVVQAGFLVGTGSTYYEPYVCALENPVTITFEGNRITGFSGATADTDRAQAHYDRVAQICGTDGGYVHSWHAGIHPGCAHPAPASACFKRWTGSAFGNPRLLHFHTGAAYAPGEISLNVLDPTIWLDDVPVWDNGRLHPDRISGGSEILQAYPCIRACFDNPTLACGQGPDDRLRFT